MPLIVVFVIRRLADRPSAPCSHFPSPSPPTLPRSRVAPTPSSCNYRWRPRGIPAGGQEGSTPAPQVPPSPGPRISSRPLAVNAVMPDAQHSCGGSGSAICRVHTPRVLSCATMVTACCQMSVPCQHGGGVSCRLFRPHRLSHPPADHLTAPECRARRGGDYRVSRPPHLLACIPPPLCLSACRGHGSRSAAEIFRPLASL